MPDPVEYGLRGWVASRSQRHDEFAPTVEKFTAMHEAGELGNYAHRTLWARMVQDDEFVLMCVMARREL
jgi:hypothetical protein